MVIPFLLDSEFLLLRSSCGQGIHQSVENMADFRDFEEPRRTPRIEDDGMGMLLLEIEDNADKGKIITRAPRAPRRLGFYSVACLCINRMIGKFFLHFVPPRPGPPSRLAASALPSIPRLTLISQALAFSTAPGR
jgi:hypothetical protein